MARQKPAATATAGTTFPTAEAADIAQLVEDLDAMLSRLRLGAIREQLDGLLEEAARRQLNLRETPAWLCSAEVASKEQRRLSMAMTIEVWLLSSRPASRRWAEASGLPGPVPLIHRAAACRLAGVIAARERESSSTK